MTKKILVADDSPTIRKVIGISLADQQYKLENAESAEELLRKVSAEKYDLILLDYTLSKSQEAYQLAREVRKFLDSPILAMLGPFDSYDEGKGRDSGISSRIVKPFESEKFASVVSELLNGNDSMEGAEEVFESSTDDWEMDGPDETTKEHALSGVDELEQELGEWGMEIPDPIDGTVSEGFFPPIIESVVESDEEFSEQTVDIPEEVLAEAHGEAAASDEIKYPDSNDLDFPSLDELSTDEEYNEELSPIRVPSRLGDLAKEELARTSRQKTNSVDLAQYIKAEKLTVDDSIRPRNTSNIWKADSEVVVQKSVIEGAIENPDIVRELASDGPHFSESELIEKLRPVVRELLQEMFSKKVEEVVWEVIPDIAENLVKSEIQKISKSILSEQ